ncbi:MAG: 1-deoxy-D-xylulose-5-phosphate reductoisomerase [Ignavibacteriaceae bacterium]|nr:1-deoxy-D-xylulose-5-phosphate reductoisomerase [Ignavibacteriaceae bacterium]
MKKVLVLGSTGSIGINTLNVIRSLPGKFQITALMVNSRIDVLEPQIEEFHPECVVVKEEIPAEQLRKKLKGKIEVLSGISGLSKAASVCDYDIFIGAMVGSAGLAPTIQAIKRGKRIGLANKETLVVAGELVTQLSKLYGAEILPIDSEHSAVFQCLIGENLNQVEKIILTASGGPFLNKTKADFLNVTIEEALNHPNWKMGHKITIDSASMMNKGLEVIEAKWLFNIQQDKIDVVIHPQSIIHSMVQFVDGSVKAQLGLPDMKLPIQYALTYPDRLQNYNPRVNLPSIKQLSFFEPDLDKFECLKIAYSALDSGGNAPCVLNAANEIAVDKFLKGNIKFSRIPYIINKSLERIEHNTQPDLDIIFQCDRQTREFAAGLS